MRFPQDVPVLSDGIVTLRAHTGADVDAIVDMCQDPQTQRWTSVPVPYARADAVNFVADIMRVGWEEKDHRGWAIEAADDDGQTRFAGNIDIRGTPIASVGFVAHPWARGRGYMRSALALATDWAFAEGGVEVIHWAAQVGNVASLRVAWATGFTLHTTMPGFLYERGRVLDAWTASLTFGDMPVPRTTWHESPVISSPSVRLRPLAESDIPRIVEACTDDTSRHWLAGLPAPYTATTARDYLNECQWLAATGNKASWALADADTDELLGNIAITGLDGLDPGSGEVGYWAHPDARGRGIMADATKLLVGHAFTTMKLRRLTLMAATTNGPSNSVALAAGFTCIGIETQAERLGDGSFADLNVYELLS